MITVAILVNGNVIMARSAYNTGEKTDDGHIYKVDTGDTINHHRSDGAVKLAMKMLATIKE